MLAYPWQVWMPYGDPAKAASYLAKHGVSPEDAMGFYADPPGLSRLDENHGASEKRWVTMGETRGRLLPAVRTYLELTEWRVMARIISARVPSRREVLQYQEGVTT